MSKQLIAANWKMNGRKAMALEFAKKLGNFVSACGHKTPDVLLCPPAPYLSLCADSLRGSPVMLGAQDCSAKDEGAVTGDISAAMLNDSGCSYVILGHSERRDYFAESNTLISTKITKAHRAGLKVVLCVGEKDPHLSREERDAIIKIQLCNSLPHTANAQNIVIAYEPVWAIGSGLTPTAKQIEDSHKSISQNLPRKMAGNTRILYGGSVNAANASEILAIKGVDGALVGGASLKFDAFSAIIKASN